MEIAIRHDSDRNRFVAPLDGGGEAVLEYRRLDGDRLDYRRTFVPEAARGQGIGEALVRFALDHARREGARVVPSCPFVKSYLDEHPAYADVAAA